MRHTLLDLRLAWLRAHRLSWLLARPCRAAPSFGLLVRGGRWRCPRVACARGLRSVGSRAAYAPGANLLGDDLSRIVMAAMLPAMLSRPCSLSWLLRGRPPVAAQMPGRFRRCRLSAPSVAGCSAAATHARRTADRVRRESPRCALGEAPTGAWLTCVCGPCNVLATVYPAPHSAVLAETRRRVRMQAGGGRRATMRGSCEAGPLNVGGSVRPHCLTVSALPEDGPVRRGAHGCRRITRRCGGRAFVPTRQSGMGAS